jgi:hypothetical protein
MSTLGSAKRAVQALAGKLPKARRRFLGVTDGNDRLLRVGAMDR